MTAGSDEAAKWDGYDMKKELSARHYRFVWAYMDPKSETRLNALRSYMYVYPKVKYGTAKTEGAKLLTKPDVRKALEYVNFISGFNDISVDASLNELIASADGRTRVAAIRHYNQLKGRNIERKVNVNVDANKLLENMMGQNADTYA